MQCNMQFLISIFIKLDVKQNTGLTVFSLSPTAELSQVKNHLVHFNSFPFISRSFKIFNKIFCFMLLLCSDGKLSLALMSCHQFPVNRIIGTISC